MSEQQEGTVQGVQTNGLSILGRIKERRQEVIEAQVLKLPVPRWSDPEIIVHYKPVEHAFIRSAQDRVSNAPKDKRYALEVQGNSDILIRGCLAVVAIIDGKQYSLRAGDENGEPTLFDRDLAETLGLDDGATARQVVKGLFIAEGDIMSASQSLVSWSGYKETEADATIQGE